MNKKTKPNYRFFCWDFLAALEAAIGFLKDGHTVAVKGIGGYHLMCNAQNDEAVAHLRTRKPRPFKPLAVLFPGDEQALSQSVEPDALSLALCARRSAPSCCCGKNTLNT